MIPSALHAMEGGMRMLMGCACVGRVSLFGLGNHAWNVMLRYTLTFRRGYVWVVPPCTIFPPILINVYLLIVPSRRYLILSLMVVPVHGTDH
jgi:hypothetical protein